MNIDIYENREYEDSIVVIKGDIPVLISSPHAISIGDKVSEPYTKGINLYLNDKIGSFSIFKNLDDGIDPNHVIYDEYKTTLKRLVRDNDIKLILDLHGARDNHGFDLELGTMNNLSVDNTTLNTLIDILNNNGINNIDLNDPFKGGLITQSLYGIEDVDVIQIEISRSYRNENNIDMVINSLTEFINTYLGK